MTCVTFEMPHIPLNGSRVTPKHTLFVRFALQDMLTLNGYPKIGSMISYLSYSYKGLFFSLCRPYQVLCIYNGYPIKSCLLFPFRSHFNGKIKTHKSVDFVLIKNFSLNYFINSVFLGSNNFNRPPFQEQSFHQSSLLGTKKINRPPKKGYFLSNGGPNQGMSQILRGHPA